MSLNSPTPSNEIASLQARLTATLEANDKLRDAYLTLLLQQQKTSGFGTLLGLAYEVLGDNLPSDRAKQLREQIGEALGGV